MIDFDGIRHEQSKWRDEAKQTFINGIDPADLKKGMRVTISPNLRHGDRSYATEILIIEAVNSGHAQVRFERPRSWGGATTILVLSEHHFYSAEGFASEAEG